MKATHLVALASLSLACGTTPAYAKCKHESMPVVLETIVVTPNDAYTQSEWMQREEARAQLAATKVTLPTIVVTPDHSVDTESRSVARANAAPATGNARASAAPSSPLRPSLISFFRRLFN